MVKIYKKYDKLEKPIVKLVDAIHALNALDLADQKNILKGVSYVLGEEINTIEAFIGAIRMLPTTDEEPVEEAKEKCFATLPIKFGEYEPEPVGPEAADPTNDVEEATETYIFDTDTCTFHAEEENTDNNDSIDYSDPTSGETAKQPIVKMTEHFGNMTLLGGARDGKIYLCKNDPNLQTKIDSFHQIYPPDYELMKELGRYYRGTAKGPTKTLMTFEQVLTACSFVKDLLMNADEQKMPSGEVCNNLRKFLDTYFPKIKLRGENIRDLVNGHSHAKISAPFFHYNTLTRMVYIN